MNLTHLMYVIVLYALFKHKLPTCCVAKEVDDRCPIPVNVQGQVLLSSEQCYLVEDVPVHCRMIVLNKL